MGTTDRLLFGALILLLAILVLMRSGQAKADMPYCFTIKNPPLEITRPVREAYPRKPDNA